MLPAFAVSGCYCTHTHVFHDKLPEVGGQEAISERRMLFASTYFSTSLTLSITLLFPRTVTPQSAQKRTQTHMHKWPIREVRESTSRNTCPTACRTQDLFVFLEPSAPRDHLRRIVFKNCDIQSQQGMGPDDSIMKLSTTFRSPTSTLCQHLLSPAASFPRVASCRIRTM